MIQKPHHLILFTKKKKKGVSQYTKAPHYMVLNLLHKTVKKFTVWRSMDLISPINSYKVHLNSHSAEYSLSINSCGSLTLIKFYSKLYFFYISYCLKKVILKTKSIIINELFHA